MKISFTELDTIEYWDSLYGQEDFYGECYRQRMNTVLFWLDSLKFGKNSMILEAGCGTGRFSWEAAKRGYSVVGVDLSRGMVVKANSRNSANREFDVGFFQGNIEALPLQPSSFDMIVCLGVVAYLKSEEKLLNSLATVLKPGGILAISIVNKARLAYHLDLPLLLVSIAKKILRDRAVSRIKNFDMNHTFTLTTYFIPKFQKSLEKAGFCVLEYKTVPWRLLTFAGKEVFPEKIATFITLFFEQFYNIPMIGSLGGMCIYKAKKQS